MRESAAVTKQVTERREAVRGLIALHTHLGTWEEVEDKTSLSGRRMKDLIKPGDESKIQKATLQLINEALRYVFPFPLPPHLALVRSALIELKKHPGATEYKNRIVELEGMLAYSNPGSPWWLAGNCYLLGWTAMARALHHGNQTNWFGGPGRWNSALQDANKFFDRGLQITACALEARTCSDVELERLKALEPFLFNNRLVVISAQAERGMIPNGEAQKSLLKLNAVATLKDFTKKHSHMWQGAWNGLIISTNQEAMDKSSAEYFYAHLKKCDPGFESFSYAPGEVPSIAKETALAKFRSVFSHLNTDKTSLHDNAN